MAKWTKEVHFETLKDLRDAIAEIRRLTDIIVNMRQQKFTLSPEHTDERWPEGRYVMGDYEQEIAERTPTRAPTPQEEMSAEVEAALIDDFDRVFADEDAED